MARVATGDIFYAADVVLLHQRRAQIGLLSETLTIYYNWIRARRLPVTHIENLIARAKILFRRAMAFQTPLHLQRLLLIHKRHLVDWTVAGIAAYAFIDVNAVIEEDEVGKLVHPRPLQRLAGAVTGADRLKQLRVGPDLRVAVHARLGGRDAGKARGLDRSVAVAAINSESGNVVLMAEGDGLWADHLCVSYVGRALQFEHRPQQRRYQEYRPVNRGAGDCVGTAMKNLHRLSVQQGHRTSSPVQCGLLDRAVTGSCEC